MNKRTIDRIIKECEKIEKENNGHGRLEVTFKDGKAHLIKPTPYIPAEEDLT